MIIQIFCQFPIFLRHPKVEEIFTKVPNSYPKKDENVFLLFIPIERDHACLPVGRGFARWAP
jgi:hypothetical protein